MKCTMQGTHDCAVEALNNFRRELANMVPAPSAERKSRYTRETLATRVQKLREEAKKKNSGANKTSTEKHPHEHQDQAAGIIVNDQVEYVSLTFSFPTLDTSGLARTDRLSSVLCSPSRGGSFFRKLQKEKEKKRRIKLQFCNFPKIANSENDPLFRHF